MNRDNSFKKNIQKVTKKCFLLYKIRRLTLTVQHLAIGMHILTKRFQI